MQGIKIIVIGASAGGVDALKTLFRGLKTDLNAAVFVVLHTAPHFESYLPEILNRQGSLPVLHARDNMEFKPGNAYVAPPNRHLILQDGRMHLTFGPKVNYTRPAIDPLFESAARDYGPDVIGVILTGLLFDGSKGLLRIQQAGGIAVVQDPQDALYPDMPESALQHIQADYLLPISEIASLLNKILEEPALEKGENQVKQTIPDSSENEVSLIREEIKSYEQGNGSNHRSVITCPECGGVLWELKDGRLMRYRCHTGHIYYAEDLLTSYDKEYEKVFWTAIRMMVEKAAVSNRLAAHAKDHNNQEREGYFRSMAKEAEVEAERIRAAWLNGKAQNSKNESAGEQANDEISGSAG